MGETAVDEHFDMAAPDATDDRYAPSNVVTADPTGNPSIGSSELLRQAARRTRLHRPAG
jgi:hypothetical protein